MDTVGGTQLLPNAEVTSFADEDRMHECNVWAETSCHSAGPSPQSWTANGRPMQAYIWAWT
eukprot:7347505-Pyramimonas_sp.AAC.1